MLLELIKIYRVKDWVHFLGLPLLGYFKFDEKDPERLILILIISAFYLAFAAVLNNWYDRYLDISQTLKNPFSKDMDSFSFYNLNAIIIIPLILSLIFAIISSFLCCLITLIGIIFAYTYSAPPARLKSIPIVGTLSNILVFIPLLYIGPVSLQTHFTETSYLALFCSFIVLIMQLFHEIEDQEDDIKGKINTIPVIYGKKVALFVNQILSMGFLVYCIFLYYIRFLKNFDLVICILYALSVIGASFLQRINGRNNIPYRLIMRIVSSILGICLLGGFIFCK